MRTSQDEECPDCFCLFHGIDRSRCYDRCDAWIYPSCCGRNHARGLYARRIQTLQRCHARRRTDQGVPCKESPQPQPALQVCIREPSFPRLPPPSPARVTHDADASSPQENSDVRHRTPPRLSGVRGRPRVGAPQNISALRQASRKRSREIPRICKFCAAASVSRPSSLAPSLPNSRAGPRAGISFSSRRNRVGTPCSIRT
jgi:hypothetical protein